MRVLGRSLESLRLVSEEEPVSERGPFVITNFRELPLQEFHPIEIAYDLKPQEDYATLTVKNEGEVTESVRSGETITFRWQPSYYVGDYELTLTTYNRKRETIRSIHFILRIIPWKIHEDDFFQIYNDLRERHLQIYDLISPARIEEREDRQRFSNFFEQAKVLEENIKELENIVFLISQNPKKKLVELHEPKLLHEAFGVDYLTLLNLARVSEQLIPASNQRIAPQLQSLLTHKRTGSAYLPEKVISRETQISYDVFENRLLKRFLMMLMEVTTLYSKMVEVELQRKISGVAQNQISIDSLSKLLSEANQLKTRVSLLLDYAFLQDVKPTTRLTHVTPTLEREVNYRRFYKIYQDFIWRPYFQTSEVFKLGIKDLPTIYETWCTLFLCETVLGLVNRSWILKTQNIFTRHRLGYAFDIKRRGPLLSLKKNSWRINLYFQRAFTPNSRPYCSYTHTQRPDITIEVINVDSSRLLIFDPKYRYNLQFGKDPESAVNKMHVYKDSIRDLEGNRVISKAYVLYPGKVGRPLKEGDLEFKVGASEIIGAIALRPAFQDELKSRKEKILNLINDLF